MWCRRACGGFFLNDVAGSHWRAVALAVALALLVGCGRAPDLSPRSSVLRTADEVGQFWPVANPRAVGPGILVFTAPGSRIDYWESFARAAQAEGYRVLVCPPPNGGTRAEVTKAYVDQYGVRTRGFNQGNDSLTNFAIVGEGSGAAAALELLSLDKSIPAVIAFSTVAADYEGEVEGMARALKVPLLLITCENDAQSAQTSQRIKDAAPGYCELQRYACGVRGVDLLSAAPSLTQSILTWLRPILREGLADPG